MTNLQNFLDLIAFSEGTSTSRWTQNYGYDILVGGVDDKVLQDHIFTDYTTHPFVTRPAKMIRRVPLLYSTAAGRYQIIRPTWEALQTDLGFKNFDKFAQDCMAVELIRQHGALEYIQSGVIEPAIFICSKIWASFPGNNYGQPGGHTMVALLTKYASIESTQSKTTDQQII